MKTMSIDVLLNSAEGALVRLLGLIGRRGYQIGVVEAHPTECGTATRVRVQMTGARPISQLVLQISKLYDVRSVRSFEAAVTLPGAAVAIAPAHAQVA